MNIHPITCIVCSSSHPDSRLASRKLSILSSDTMRVAVIGAGPSGLVTLKYLKWAHRFLGVEPVEVKLFEKDDCVGGVFAHRVYEDAEVRRPKKKTKNPL
jgi:NADPH-dependent glutamate synthase beta subunit-like oxidoreductase